MATPTWYGNHILDIGRKDFPSGVDPTVFFLLAFLPLDVVDAVDLSKLETAAHETLFDTVKHLVTMGVLLSNLPFTSSELLLRWCSERDVMGITWLIEMGASVNTRSPDWQTPLHMVFHPKSPEVHRFQDPGIAEKLVRLLLDAGADMNAADATGYTIVHLAASYSLLDILATLRTRKADFKAVTTLGHTDLHVAVIRNCHEAVWILLDMDEVDVNARDKEGMTALHHVCLPPFESPPLALRLIRSPRVDKCALDHEGNSALDYFRKSAADEYLLRELENSMFGV
jgi:ankyrin repeat protein